MATTSDMIDPERCQIVACDTPQQKPSAVTVALGELRLRIVLCEAHKKHWSSAGGPAPSR